MVTIGVITLGLILFVAYLALSAIWRWRKVKMAEWSKKLEAIKGDGQ